jgi:hypothetical protein
MKVKYRGFVGAGILGCILVLLTTPLLAQTAANKNPCNSVTHYVECGVIKGCKVAGPGIAVGTPFTFTHSDSYSSGTATIPAGPAPGGYCQHSDPLPVGTIMAIKENIPAGDEVTNIVVTPASQIAVPPNPSAGTVSVKVGPGVTEVKYINKSLKATNKMTNEVTNDVQLIKPRFGYLEICKKADDVPGAPPLKGDFTFTINPGSIGPITVPVGNCSPPIEVPVGTVTIKETPRSGAHMVSCSAYPASRQGACNPTAWTSTVTVPSGGLSTQTIATITNELVKGSTGFPGIIRSDIASPISTQTVATITTAP